MLTLQISRRLNRPLIDLRHIRQTNLLPAVRTIEINGIHKDFIPRKITLNINMLVRHNPFRLPLILLLASPSLFIGIH